ncbi:MAG: extracellular solute-binding protein [Parcubacteria group bacterium]|jgi:multiple sugar transport system substrate-binding protein
MNTKIKFLSAILLLSGIIFLSGCGLKDTPAKRYPVSLEVWGLFDDSDAFNNIFDKYQKANSNIRLTYKKLTPDTYKNEVISALASGQGPDIFLIQNTWLPSFQDKILPATADILTEQKFRADFVDVVAADFVEQGKIYAAPLTVDSLGLYYNKDLFNQAGITTPPVTWNDFVEDVKKITRIDSTGNIVRSGAAIGTAYNINRSTDILNMLLLQNNTSMINDRQTQALFDQGSARDNNGNSVTPGVTALSFYTQFARANSAYYSWNPSLHYSTDAFSEGTVGMMFNYSWQADTIRAKAPKLNFAVAPVPQLTPTAPINFPNYWGFAVAKNKIAPALPAGSKQVVVSEEVRVAEAWNFVKFLTTKPEMVAGQTIASFDAAADYAKATNKPAARRDLIEVQKTDVNIGAFAQGNLIAKSWKQIDPIAIEAIFAGMIDGVNRGAVTTEEAIKAAATQVTGLMNR